MEESNSKLKKWALWIGGIIVLIIVAMFIKNQIQKNADAKAIENSNEAKSLLSSQPLKDEIKAEVRKDVFDILSQAHLTLGNQ